MQHGDDQTEDNRCNGTVQTEGPNFLEEVVHGQVSLAANGLTVAPLPQGGLAVAIAIRPTSAGGGSLTDRPGGIVCRSQESLLMLLPRWIGRCHPQRHCQWRRWGLVQSIWRRLQIRPLSLVAFSPSSVVAGPRLIFAVELPSSAMIILCLFY